MGLKKTGTSIDWREIDRFEDGVGWLAHPDERMQRASHALVDDGDVWVVDPVDVPGLDDLLAEFGTVRGVVLLLDRHRRDSDTIAARHDVPVWAPQFFDGVEEHFDAPVREFRHDLGGSGMTAHRLVDNRFWQEALLLGPDEETLVVPEAVGTASYFTTGDRPLGVHPMLRLRPPRRLTRLAPERVLVGHGGGIHEDATAELEAAIRGARRRTPRLALETARSVLPF